MTRKKITSIPTEYLWNAERVIESFEFVSHMNPLSMHSFNEASVVKQHQIVFIVKATVQGK